MDKQNFYDLNFNQLKNFLTEKAEVDEKKAKMRAQQMFNAVYKKNIKNFDELTTFGLELKDATSKIRGKAGTEVILTIKKPNTGEVQDYSIIRDVISYGGDINKYLPYEIDNIR